MKRVIIKGEESLTTFYNPPRCNCTGPARTRSSTSDGSQYHTPNASSTIISREGVGQWEVGAFASSPDPTLHGVT